ncbi:MAG TPA: PDZ domain-containing protein, partial [Pyrinomonadaceae bacterium]|nr:PDZ domain-containing protein [Pyrinomonadaceae bacterium]
YLYNEFYKKDRNYSPEDFQKACEAMAGTSLDSFFSKYVRAKDELDFNASLSTAGLKLETTATGEGGKPIERVFLGADTQEVDGKLIVRRVIAGSPAYDQGLNSGDQIVALNNMRTDKQFFDARIAEKKPGDLINLTIFRADDLSTLLIKLGGRSDISYRIVPLPNVTPAQKEVYRAWLGVGTN